jgi:hypothetical protein
MSAVREGRRVNEMLRHDLTVTIRNGLSLPEPSRQPVPAAALAPPRIIAETPLPRPRGEIHSATRIRTYLECPMRYYLTYRLGYRVDHSGAAPVEELREEGGAEELGFSTGPLPGAGADTAPARADAAGGGVGRHSRRRDEEAADAGAETGADAGSGELLGTLFHSVMRAVESTDASDRSIEAACASLLSQEGPLAGAEPLRATAASVSRLVRGVLASRTWADIRKGTEVRSEYTVSAPFGRDYIVGTIDRVFRDEGGMWTVVDYKTDRVPADAIEARARLYLPQVQLYGLLVSMLYGVDSVRLMLLFAHHPDRPYVVMMHRGDIDAFARLVTDVVSGIAQNRFTPASGRCDACPFPPGTCERLFPAA